MIIEPAQPTIPTIKYPMVLGLPPSALPIEMLGGLIWNGQLNRYVVENSCVGATITMGVRIPHRLFPGEAPRAEAGKIPPGHKCEPFILG